MSTTRFRQLGAGLLLGWFTLAACGNDDVSIRPPSSNTSPDGEAPSESVHDAGGGSTNPLDGGSSDGAPTDAGIDAPSPRACTGSGTVPLGDYLAADGAQHWLRKTASATTYTRIPGGQPTPSKTPVLWQITQTCSDQKAFIATNEGGTFARVDWKATLDGIDLCIAIEGAADAAAAIAAPSSNASATATGCNGAPWTLLASRKDGGR
jgi:hypothetical protein